MRKLPPLLTAMVFLTVSPGCFGSPEHKLVGEADLRVMFIPIYQSKLFTDTGKFDGYSQPIRFDIHYKIPVSSRQLVRQTGEEWKNLGVNDQKRRTWLQQLLKLWPDVNRDDQLSLVMDTDRTVTFYHNGDHLGSITDTDFGPSFLDIWLSANSSRPKLRAKLLGL